MLQNELKAMLNEEECIGVPADEEYQEYLIDYILDENLLKMNFQITVCFNWV